MTANRSDMLGRQLRFLEERIRDLMVSSVERIMCSEDWCTALEEILDQASQDIEFSGECHCGAKIRLFPDEDYGLAGMPQPGDTFTFECTNCGESGKLTANFSEAAEDGEEDEA